MKIYRCKLARLNGCAMLYLSFIGTLAGVPAGWSIVTKRIAK